MKLTENKIEELKLRLNPLLEDPALVAHAKEKDPIGLVYPYKYKEDQEAVAF